MSIVETQCCNLLNYQIIILCIYLHLKLLNGNQNLPLFSISIKYILFVNIGCYDKAVRGKTVPTVNFIVKSEKTAILK